MSAPWTRVLWVAAVMGGCVFGSRPILPQDPDPTTVDAGPPGAGGGVDAALRQDSGISAMGSDVAYASQDAAAAQDVTVSPSDAASAQDAAAGAVDAGGVGDATAPTDAVGVGDGAAPDGSGVDAAADARRLDV